MTDSLLPNLRAIFSEQLEIDVPPSPDTDLFEAGLLDSLRLVELLLHIEASLGCRIALDEIELDDLRSLNGLARLIRAREAQQAA